MVGHGSGWVRLGSELAGWLAGGRAWSRGRSIHHPLQHNGPQSLSCFLHLTHLISLSLTLSHSFFFKKKISPYKITLIITVVVVVVVVVDTTLQLLPHHPLPPHCTACSLEMGHDMPCTHGTSDTRREGSGQRDTRGIEGNQQPRLFLMLCPYCILFNPLFKQLTRLRYDTHNLALWDINRSHLHLGVTITGGANGGDQRFFFRKFYLIKALEVV
jgi:hypothetical protein